jgi:hypothetical protein
VFALASCGLTPADAARGAPDDQPQPNELVYPGAEWRALPSLATAGWDERRLDEAKRFAEANGLHAVMIVDRGLVVAEWGCAAS